MSKNLGFRLVYFDDCVARNEYSAAHHGGEDNNYADKYKYMRLKSISSSPYERRTHHRVDPDL